MSDTDGRGAGPRLRSRAWFDNTRNPDMTALYIARNRHHGRSLAEQQSNRPIIGIAQNGGDLVPSNRHHLALGRRVKDGIRHARGILIEYATIPPARNRKASSGALRRLCADRPEALRADMPVDDAELDADAARSDRISAHRAGARIAA